MLFDAWLAWEKHGILPYSGGFLDQPLRIMNIISVCSVIYNTLKAAYSPNGAKMWATFTDTQVAIVRHYG